VPGGVVRDDGVRNALPGQFPGGEPGTLRAGAGLIDIDEHPSPLPGGSINRRQSAPPVHEGKPPGIAVRENARAPLQKERTVAADGLPGRGILICQAARHLHGSPPACRGRTRRPRRRQHAIDGVKEIHRGGTRRAQGGCPGLQRPEPAPVLRRFERDLGHAIAGCGTDGSGASDGHRANGLGRVPVRGQVDDGEAVRQEVLVDHPHHRALEPHRPVGNPVHMHAVLALDLG